MGSMDRWIGKLAVVTGAAEGIGYAITEQLVNSGVNVVAVDLKQLKLDEVSKKLQGRKGKIFIYLADVGKEEDILGLFKWVKENVGPVYILVNNANVFPQTSLTEGDTKLWKSVIDVQVIGLCIATREAVQDMRANKVDGHIIHMNATDGHKVANYPNLSVNPACKFAITALTETLRNELNLYKDKIKVTSISPGLVDTEGVQAIFKKLTEGLTPETIAQFPKFPMLHAVDVANAVTYVLSTPPHVQIHELMIKPIGEAT